MQVRAEVAHKTHNLEVASSNLAPATKLKIVNFFSKYLQIQKKALTLHKVLKMVLSSNG